LLRAFRTPGGHRRVEPASLTEFAAKRGFPVPATLRQVESASTLPRVLVIDDEEDFAEVLRDVLTDQLGVEVMLAYSALEAGLLAGESKPSVILMDLTMPDLDGVAARITLSKHNTTRDVPICALVPHGEVQLHEEASRSGFQAVLAKPVQLSHLLSTVRMLLDMAHAPAAVVA
jgi:CheY-like chemotaxis protein